MAAERSLRGEVVSVADVRPGAEAEVVLDLWWAGPSVDAVEAVLHGLAGARLTLEGGRAVVRPELRRRVVGLLRLPTGLDPGRYDLAVELRCQLDVDAVLLLPLTIEVVAPPVPSVHVGNVRLRGGLGRAEVLLENPIDEPQRVALTAAGRRQRFRFEPPVVEVPANGSATARLWVRAGGRRGRFVVTAATSTAHSTAVGTIRGRRDGAILLVVAAVLLGILAGIGSPTSGLSRWNGLSPFGGVLASAPTENHALSDFEADLEEAQGAGATLPGGPVGTGGAVDPSGTPSGTVEGGAVAPDGTVEVGSGCEGSEGDGLRVRGVALARTPVLVAARPAGEARDPTATATAGDDGTFELCDLPPGDYLVEARAEGYNTLVVSAPLAGLDVDLGRLRLQPGAATMLGTVIGPSGPVADAIASVLVDGVEVGWARTDADGEFLVLGVPAPAEAVLVVEAVGFVPALRPVTIRVADRIRVPGVILQQGA